MGIQRSSKLLDIEERFIVILLLRFLGKRVVARTRLCRQNGFTSVGMSISVQKQKKKKLKNLFFGY